VIENHGGYFCPVNVFVENIGKIRRSLGYTQEYMAEQLGLETNTYSKMERGYIALSVERLMDISKIFNMSIAEIEHFSDMKNYPLFDDKMHILIEMIQEYERRKGSPGAKGKSH